MTRLLQPGPRPNLPPRLRERLLTIPERDRVGLPMRSDRRRLPAQVRSRLVAIPADHPRRSLAQRWFLDARGAMAASLLVAVLLTPVVEAATPRGRDAANSVAASVSSCVATHQQRLATSPRLQAVRDQLLAIPGLARTGFDTLMTTSKNHLTAAGDLLKGAIPPQVAITLGFNPPNHPPTGEPQP